MPQKGLKRDDGVWGRREKTFLKSFSLLPRSLNALAVHIRLQGIVQYIAVKFFF